MSATAAPILIVEDSATQAELLRSILADRAYPVVVASNGQQALDAIRKQAPGLIISDIEMPGMSGYELCKAVKTDPRLSGIPVILLTSFADPADVLRGLEARADHYITKPFDTDFLLKQIQAIVNTPVERHPDPPGQPIKVEIGGERQFVTASRPQILNLLLSTYANAVQRNRELIRSQSALTWANSELAEVTSRLRQNEERYRAVVEQIGEGICLIDAQTQRVIEANAAFRRLLGFSAEDVELLTSDDFRFLLDDRESSLKNVAIASFCRHRRYVRPDKETVDLEFDGRMIEYGGLRVICLVARDITDQRNNAEALVEAKKAAENASLAKSQFLAHMSHEIRTPLNGIVGMIELLSASNLSAEQQRYAQMARSSAEALTSLINDILDLSKIEAGKLDLEHIDFDAHLVVEDAVQLLAQKAAAKSLELTCFVDPAVPRHVQGDPDRFRQIIVNLVSNAVKFTNTGAVTVIVTIEREEAEHILLRFAVNDSGIGIPRDRLDRLFKAFSQADASTTRTYGGTGLGLAICKQLTELMGGRIGVESEFGRGSTFWFTAQFVKSPQADLMSETASLDARGIRVLAVDDNSACRETLARQLASWGMQAAVAANGADAIEVLRQARRARRPFRIALIDEDMPGMSGSQLAEAVKAEPDIRATVLMLLVSIDQHIDAQRLRQLGFDGFMTKPVRQSQLFDSIMNTLAAAENEESSPRPHESPDSAAAQPLANVRILLAEDNEVNQVLASELLHRAGCHVEIASNGREALAAVLSMPFDLVLMDCQMPEMDGYTVTREIRDAEKRGALTASGLARIPIIALTANAIKGDREACLAAGMDEYLSKPLDPKKLIHLIRTHTSECNATAIPQPRPAQNQPAPGATVPDRASDAPISVEAIRKRWNCDEKFAATLIRAFQDQLRRDLDPLADALNIEDLQTTALIAHRLKGAAIVVEALRVKALAGRIENMARAGDLTGAAECLRELQSEAQRCFTFELTCTESVNV